MTYAKVVWWGGLATVLAGILLLISDVLEFFVFNLESFSTIAPTGVYTLVLGGFLLASLLLLLGLTGLYMIQVESAGTLGFIGFLTAFAGTVLVTGVFWAQEFFVPAVAEVAPGFLDSEQPGWLNFGLILSFSLFVTGWLMFGVATLRAQIYPFWSALLLMAGAVLFVLPVPVPSLLFTVAVVWLGYNLLTGRAPQSTTDSKEPTNA